MPNGDSLEVNVVAVHDGTAPAVTAHTDAAPVTAPTVTAPADPAQRADEQPADTNWVADTPVQVAYFEGPDGTAPAGIKGSVSILGWAPIQLHEVHKFSCNICSDGSPVLMSHARNLDDHNVALKHCRRWMEIEGIFILELAPVVPIVECAHAVIGPEFFWWKPLPGNPPASVLFKWSWKDFLTSLNDAARREIFGDRAQYSIVAAFCLRLPDSCEYKRAQNSRYFKAASTKLPDGEQHKHCLTGFAFVRDDGCIIFFEPK